MPSQAVLLALILVLNSTSLADTETAIRQSTPAPSQNDNVARVRLAQLLTKPACLQSPGDSGEAYRVEAVSFRSGKITLAGKLYLPSGGQKHRAVVFMHGGGNDYDLIMSAPKYYARRLAQCGFAALIYDKRGTGQSGGAFHEATYDDFITDAGNAAVFLSRDERIDPARIAIYGGSEGGQLAPIASIRFPIISAVISVSGPFVSAVEQANHNINYALRSRGYSDSLMDVVMPLWRRHHAAWASRDPVEMRALAAEIERLRATVDTFALPNTEQEIVTDTNLFFLMPGFNSMMEDYTAELAGVRVPFLALYGELDPIVDVRKSIANLRQQMAIGGHDDFEIIVIDSVGHSFVHQRSREQTPIVNIILNWLDETLRRP
jgi:uncharacterized protein